MPFGRRAKIVEILRSTALSSVVHQRGFVRWHSGFGDERNVLEISSLNSSKGLFPWPGWCRAPRLFRGIPG